MAYDQPIKASSSFERPSETKIIRSSVQIFNGGRHFLIHGMVSLSLLLYVDVLLMPSWSLMPQVHGGSLSHGHLVLLGQKCT